MLAIAPLILLQLPGCSRSDDVAVVAVPPALPDLPPEHEPRCLAPTNIPSGGAGTIREHRLALKECADKHQSLGEWYRTIRRDLQQNF